MNNVLRKISVKWLLIVTSAVIAIAAGVSRNTWVPVANTWVQRVIASFRPTGAAADADGHGEEPDAHASHDHSGHDHAAHAGHEETESLELSDQALRNIGLTADTLRPVSLQTFRRSITVPAIVAERPGRTRVQVATPMTGVITHAHVVQGEAVEPGTLLFQIRLTHEDLVQAQTTFVMTLGELDVERREIARLSDATQSGVVPRRTLLERQYASDKLVSSLQAQREALRLHGLSEAQIQQIEAARRLLRELQIFAPSVDDHSHDELMLSGQPFQPTSLPSQNGGNRGSEFAAGTNSGRVRSQHDEEDHSDHTGPLVVQEMSVHKGQSVSAGEMLCILADYEELFIEGLAFEQDISQLRRASENDWKVDAIFDQPGELRHEVTGLDIEYLANQVNTDSRTLHFYVRLPNEITRDKRSDGNRYVEWRYLPGQRLQLRVPVEEWPEQIVLPVEAIAREGTSRSSSGRTAAILTASRCMFSTATSTQR
ncbi:MAG: efflux RND transporter periplasmic adaptor subunit [Planctomycetaceae bacterium]